MISYGLTPLCAVSSAGAMMTRKGRYAGMQFEVVIFFMSVKRWAFGKDSVFVNNNIRSID